MRELYVVVGLLVLLLAAQVVFAVGVLVGRLLGAS